MRWESDGVDSTGGFLASSIMGKARMHSAGGFFTIGGLVVDDLSSWCLKTFLRKSHLLADSGHKPFQPPSSPPPNIPNVLPMLYMRFFMEKEQGVLL